MRAMTLWLGVPMVAGIAAWAAIGPDLPSARTSLPQPAERATQAMTPSEDDAGAGAGAGAPAATTKPERLHLRAVGDVMMGTLFPANHLPEDDGASMLEPVTPWLKDADVTFANLEGPLCDEGITTKCGPRSTACYAFRSPQRYAKHLVAAGVDVVSTANNHSGDFGEACRRTTEATLDEAGIRWSGPAGSIATVDVHGAKLAVVAFHANAECNNLLDPVGARAIVERAAQTHDWTVVSFHGGAEGSDQTHVPDRMEIFYGESRGHLRAFARNVIAAGADLVIGHGPHVPRGLEVVDGHLVAYSLGNFATWREFNLSGPLGMAPILDVVIDKDGKFVEGAILSTLQTGNGGPKPDDARNAAKLMRSLSEADFPNTAPAFLDDGTIRPR